ncbi:MAG: deaminated glutathione amidase [Solirubrobacteraceae bacterium]|jgi:predicted amidohydrolase|nr:deaminated glutathione amidase [Solirubrobacteraceae bacterium]
MRVAAVQLEPVIADVAANLAACERLAGDAARAGAEWIVLPEFFTTGIAFRPELAGAALAPDGAALEMLRGVAKRHGVHVGGSFLCRDATARRATPSSWSTPRAPSWGATTRTSRRCGRTASTSAATTTA